MVAISWLPETCRHAARNIRRTFLSQIRVLDASRLLFLMGWMRFLASLLSAEMFCSS
uniref:Uncharacterized protein n=1 Tax=Oryza sativa subsp. japonica TaxID=39947 RepID=Q6H5H6_ORYSJ|nr:hypothetical protein [Oryza sativa Japonica Group]